MDDLIVFREAGIEDLDLLVRMRMDFIVELRPCNNQRQIDEIRTKTREYFRNVISRKEYIGFIGERGSEPVCCAGLLIYQLPPLINSIDRVQGHVLNVFTYPEYRCSGYGKKLVEFVIQVARDKGINRLFLNTTAMGERLYKELGFRPEDRAMGLSI